MKLQYCLSVMIKNKTKHCRLLKNKLVFWIIWGNTLNEFLIYSSPALSTAGFLHLILQRAFKKNTYLISFCISRLWWHTLELWKSARIWFKIFQNEGNTCQVFGGKPPCHMNWHSSGPALVFDTEDSVNEITPLLLVMVRLLWRSAYMWQWRWSKQLLIGIRSDERIKCSQIVLIHFFGYSDYMVTTQTII